MDNTMAKFKRHVHYIDSQELLCSFHWKEKKLNIGDRQSYCPNNNLLDLHKYMLEKTEGAINNGQSRDTGNIRHTGHETKTNKKHNTTQKTKRWATRTLQINRWCTHVLAYSKQFLFLIRHPSCYSINFEIPRKCVS